MRLFKNWKRLTLLLLAIVLFVGILWVLIPKISRASEARITSPNGEIALEVRRRIGDDSFEWKHSKGPDWSVGTTSMQGITQFREGSFSPDSRHLILTFLDANGKEQYYWMDYETSLGGGLPLEIACKAEESCAAEIKKDKIWTDISFRFLGWHPRENRALFAYELMTEYDRKHSGYFWYDMEARYKEDAVYVKELPLD